MEELIDKLKRELEIRNFSKKTVSSYIYSVEKFLGYSKTKGRALDEDCVKDYVQGLLKHQNPSSVSRNLSAVKFFFETVLKQKISLPNPKKNKTIPVILTAEEARKLIEATSNIKHRLIVKLLYGCGLRVSELVNLRKKDFNFEESLISIKLSKWRKDRFVKIPDSIKNELKNYYELNIEDIFFPSPRGGKLTTAAIQKIIKTSAKKAGIN